MKHNYFWLLFIACLFSSCAQLYNYIQVLETKSSSEKIKVVDNGMLYEDENCSIYYSFWAEGGDASFAIYNKTDEIMYVDLSKSFFIRNNIANDYYKEREWVEAGTLSSTDLNSILTTASSNITETYGINYTTAIANSHTTIRTVSSSVKEQKILAIPPMSSKIVVEYSINNNILKNCDLERYPAEKASMEFDESDSPLRFSNYITYTLGTNLAEHVLTNSFYVSKITNYAEPSAYQYIERIKPCQNLTSDDSKNYETSYPIKVYDRCFTFYTYNCFYLKYNILTKRRLYKEKEKLYYSPYYDGYTEVGTDEQSEYQQKLIDPFARAKK